MYKTFFGLSIDLLALHTDLMGRIGLFDSGYGGLTILHGMLDELPQFSYLYLGDNARAPYGSRSAEELFAFTCQGVEFLFAHDCPLVILACNTASAVALRRVQRELLPQKYPDRRVLGILVPTIEQITGTTWKNEQHGISAPLGTMTVGVLATEQTVASGSYPAEIHKRNPSIQVIQQACPGLVEAIEAGQSGEVTKLLHPYLQQLSAKVPENTPPISAILLGCTHYALIADTIRSLLPADVRLYEQPTIVAKSLKKYLAAHPEIAERLERKSQCQFMTTGNATDVSQHSSRYFGRTIEFAPVELG